jgi:membrane-associated phospholipid phosphatase
MTRTNIIALVTACVFLSTSSPSPAQADEPGRPLRFNKVADGVITPTLGAFLVLTEFAFKKQLAPRRARWTDGDQNTRSKLNSVDRWTYGLRGSHRDDAAESSDVLAFVYAPVSAFVLNAAAAYAYGDRGGRIGENSVIMLEATLAAMALNQTTKFIAGRRRPCAHFAEVEWERGSSKTAPCGAGHHDDNLSFFSGHTTITAALMASSGTVASMRGYKLAPLVWGSGALFMLTTGYLRIAATKHYFTDVVTGAVIGTLVGALIPYAFHRPQARDAGAPSGDPARTPQTFGFSGAF